MLAKLPQKACKVPRKSLLASWRNLAKFLEKAGMLFSKQKQLITLIINALFVYLSVLKI